MSTSAVYCWAFAVMAVAVTLLVLSRANVPTATLSPMTAKTVVTLTSVQR